eukprot:gnl/TRDRNA2_/TRDRNA2_85279_c0_seq1.p1 gnl/TRDRNA2_/TRDRNA2_85279_c0~~gnl/TRDRNA2_/TRDRNA2_85279_c0_seq1.p1  ORF type:complete len:170 (+),score=30.43 gnl/TRDRNA2_/TRDRNA2_85279_c0_seq1:92-601(+)
MGSVESVQNDTNEPVKVWFQLVGFTMGPHSWHLMTMPQELGAHKTLNQKFTLSFFHQVCTDLPPPANGDEHMMACQREFSAPFAGEHKTIKVSEITLKGEKLPFYEDPDAQLIGLGQEMQISGVEKFVPCLLALASFMFAVIGVKKLRRSRKSNRDLQEPLCEEPALAA